MRIAITADPHIPVPPQNYGGIERIIDFLVTGLINRGHDVVLVAHRHSKTQAPLISYKDSQGAIGHFNNILTIASLKAFNPDIIHSFSRLAYLLPFMLSAVPKLMSYQREPTLRQIKKAVKLANKNSLSFTGCSDYISGQIKPFGSAYTVYNGVDLSIYEPTTEYVADHPLVFLGRVEPIKGVHIAIEAAIKAKRKLIIAGNIPAEYRSYFELLILPYLNDQIVYVGPVNDTQKNEILKNASALLMPILWNEPFGIVMAEAMACGTPIIGFNRGSVPEVINESVGFICSDLDEMVNAIDQLESINRNVVRRYCEVTFGSDVIVNNYIMLYQNLIKK
ncbi:glycosyltransferase [Pedobacter mucosus]|uniref:glycosyltransferase n=1 Tax=Pedobacter mucosus TaxID=2895286 RepID=UPI001EE3EAAC|nr:glycosyltransferase [Pedobacter mucosus]UKT64386.1 glycosyltransferase [Pedobacter mucosus]